MKSKPPVNALTDMLTFVAEQTVQLTKQNATVGTPIEKNGLTIIPVSQFSASFAGGGVDSYATAKQAPAGGGAKVSLIPMSFLVIDGNDVRTVNLQTPLQAKVNEIVDAVMDAINKQKEAK